jgi:excisionase family DNA binding protein
MSHTAPTIDPASIREIARLRARLRAQIAQREALGVPPAVAEEMLGCSHRKLYDLLNAGQLDSYKIGVRGRRITVASIKHFIEMQLAQYPRPRARHRGG